MRVLFRLILVIPKNTRPHARRGNTALEIRKMATPLKVFDYTRDFQTAHFEF